MNSPGSIPLILERSFNILIYLSWLSTYLQHTLNGCGYWIFLWLLLTWGLESGSGRRWWQCTLIRTRCSTRSWTSTRCLGSSTTCSVLWDEPRCRGHRVAVVIRHPQQQKLNLKLESTRQNLVIPVHDMTLELDTR